MSDKHATFEELLDQCRRGNASAMAQLAREYESELRIVAKARIGAALKPYLDSVDLVQSVHRSLLIGLRDDKFNIASPENLVALALTIVRRKAARHWRNLRRQQRLSGGDDSTMLAEILINNSSDLDNPEQTVALHEVVERILLELEPVDRELIVLRLEGFSTVEAARKLRLNPDVTRVRLSRLRQKLIRSGVADDLV